MKLSFNYEDRKIEYNLNYKKRSTIAINVEKDGTINVVAPVGLSLGSVIDKVKGNVHWLIAELDRMEKLKTFEQSQSTNQTEDFTEEKYTYLGKTYGVEVIDNQNQNTPIVKLLRGKFVVEGKNIDNILIKDTIKKWYTTKATIKLKERLKLSNKVNTLIELGLLKNKMYEIFGDKIILDINCIVGPSVVFDYLLEEIFSKIDGLSQQETTDKLTARNISVFGQSHYIGRVQPFNPFPLEE